MFCLDSLPSLLDLLKGFCAWRLFILSVMKKLPLPVSCRSLNICDSINYGGIYLDLRVFTGGICGFSFKIREVPQRQEMTNLLANTLWFMESHSLPFCIGWYYCKVSTKLRRLVSARLGFREVEGKKSLWISPCSFLYISQTVQQVAKRSSAVSIAGGFQDPTVQSCE